MPPPTLRILYLYFDGHTNSWRASWTPQIGRVLLLELEPEAEVPLMHDTFGKQILVED